MLPTKWATSGASTTFNGTSGNCSGNRSAGSAYEPGSGITIMAYAGICGSQDLDAHSIDTFHVKSFETSFPIARPETAIPARSATDRQHAADGRRRAAARLLTYRSRRRSR